MTLLEAIFSWIPKPSKDQERDEPRFICSPALRRKDPMNQDEAGRLQKAWKTKFGDTICPHARIVEHLTTPDGQHTESVVCKECGRIVPSPHPAS